MEYSIYQKKYNPEGFTNDKHYEFLPGQTIIKTNDVVEFQSDQVIYGHDVTHPVIANLMNQIGLGFIAQTSNVNEAIVLGLSLEMIPQFRTDFRGEYISDEKGEIKRVKYLIDSFSKGELSNATPENLEAKTIEIEKQTNHAVKVFILALQLGKLFKKNRTGISQEWCDIYTKHKDWYFNSESESEFSLKVGSENKIELTSEEEQIVMRITKLCNQLPYWTYTKQNNATDTLSYYQKVYSTYNSTDPNKKVKLLETRSQFFRNDKTELDSTITVEGHDITHAIITSYLESIGVEKTSQGTVLNEALVAGVGFKAIEKQREKYGVPKENALKYEEKGFKDFAVKILSEGIKANDENLTLTDFDPDFNKNIDNLMQIFRYSRFLGNLILNTRPNLAQKWNDLFISHMEFIERHEDQNNEYNKDDSEYSVKTGQLKNKKDSEKFKTIVNKINNLIYLLPDYMRYGLGWND